jgi:hypothetical protein
MHGEHLPASRKCIKWSTCSQTYQISHEEKMEDTRREIGSEQTVEPIKIGDGGTQAGENKCPVKP